MTRGAGAGAGPAGAGGGRVTCFALRSRGRVRRPLYEPVQRINLNTPGAGYGGLYQIRISEVAPPLAANSDKAGVELLPRTISTAGTSRYGAGAANKNYRFPCELCDVQQAGARRIRRGFKLFHEMWSGDKDSQVFT
ncbi:hypothetical protein EVAR_60838_1 [Eumeta japonica]|uniref:Uncharacterized protein n=1 Tax=Eumeta variegata TaxID=151549 RepID=A0A4C1Y7F1_EUMVA|nr:hypothetical protein EVAR_60838_1 [Eumeta japonica]